MVPEACSLLPFVCVDVRDGENSEGQVTEIGKRELAAWAWEKEIVLKWKLTERNQETTRELFCRE
jgi:hypothetical protein